jgi:hypothetical protein
VLPFEASWTIAFFARELGEGRGGTRGNSFPLFCLCMSVGGETGGGAKCSTAGS